MLTCPQNNYHSAKFCIHVIAKNIVMKQSGATRSILHSGPGYRSAVHTYCCHEVLDTKKHIAENVIGGEMNEFLILFILKIQSSNIYEIKKYIDTHFAPFLEVSTGAIIPALKRLEKADCVISEKSVTDGGLRRSIYSLTDKGILAIDEYLEQQTESAPQLLRRETEVLMMLLEDENLSGKQKELLVQKIKNSLNNNIKRISNQMKFSGQNAEYLNMELVFQEAKLRMLNNEE